MQARLEKIDVFKSDAVELAAGKVAALSGDVRRALQICRRSTEIAGARHRSAAASGAGVGSSKAPRVTVQDINDAAKELSTTQHIVALKSASDWERAFLICVYLHLTANATEDVEFESVYHRMKTVCLRSCKLGEQPTLGEVSSCNSVGKQNMK